MSAGDWGILIFLGCVLAALVIITFAAHRDRS